jgi:CBS domain-containing protein
MTANIDDVMQHEVITAHLTTDVRAITKVLLESHIGAMPIVEDKQLLGMVTRSDVLRAVMHDLHLNVWM